MHLREARLCLDCEELHTEDRCPVCASDAFAFVTRWVPSNERSPRFRRPPPPPSRRVGWLTGGAAGLALFATTRWLLSPSAAKRDEQIDRKVPDETDEERGEDQRS